MPDHKRLMTPFERDELPVPAGPVLWLRGDASPVLDLFDPAQLHVVQGFRPAHDRVASRGITTLDKAGDGYDMALVSITRNRVETRGLIATAWAALNPGGTLVVDGDKSDGIEGLLKDAKTVLPVEGTTSKAHGKVFWATRQAPDNPAIAQWRDAAQPRTNDAGFVVAPGIFSADGVDPGSARLASHFTAKISGRVADFGAGWGWLSNQLLTVAPDITAIDLYEAEAAALDAARHNVTDPRAGYFWADVPNTACREPYDTIIMNPPFHQTRKAEPQLGIGFITSAQRFLKPGGQLWMVANRHLPYEATLEKAFRRIEKRHEDTQFKVFRASKPRR